MDNKSGIKNQILVRKASGEEELFSSEKLERSLLNAGAASDTILKIVHDLQNWISSGVTTKKIYARAFSILRHENTSISLKYKLKQAIFDLGPTGYPFEFLIGQVFKRQGFSTEVGIVVDGHCLKHEMDVIATLAKNQHLVECKYHKDQGKQVSIQVPLYVHSRVADIIKKRQKMPEYSNFSFSAWVVTNTRFSSDSIQYGKCIGMNLLAWDYPVGNGLKEMVEKYKIYPVTVLNNLTAKEKQYLIGQNLITCSQLLENPETLSILEIPNARIIRIKKELNDICF